MSPLIQYRGFTLIELLVTLAVLVIVTTVAVPSFRNLAESNRMTGLANEMVAAVNLARSEAVKRGAPVSVCAAGGWEDGWSVREGAACTGAILRVWDAPDAGPTMTTRPANLNRVTFAALGNRANAIDCIHLSGASSTDDRILVFGASGAISVVRGDECPTT